MKLFAIFPVVFLSLAVATPVLSAQSLARSAQVGSTPLPTAMSAAPFVATVQPPASSDPTTAGEPPRGPSADAARAGIAPRTSQERTLALAKKKDVGAGQNVALMVVGGAALITGLIIGGDGGTLVAVGGAAVGLVGLYHFIK